LHQERSFASTNLLSEQGGGPIGADAATAATKRAHSGIEAKTCVERGLRRVRGYGPDRIGGARHKYYHDRYEATQGVQL
jgi:hypothetical protein